MLFESKRRGRPSKRPDTNTLAELYATHTMAEIAEKYGVGRATVHAWIADERKKELAKEREMNG